MSENSPPILMSMPEPLRFSAEGVWSHGGVEVINERIALFFSTRLRYSQEHSSHIIEQDGRCVKVEVEDTPFVVRSIDVTQPAWQLLLNDASAEPFQPEALSATPDGAYYVRCKSGNYEAKLLRPAVQALLPFITESNGGYAVAYGGELHPIQLRR